MCLFHFVKASWGLLNTLLLLYYDITGFREKVVGITNACAIGERRQSFLLICA